MEIIKGLHLTCQHEKVPEFLLKGGSGEDNLLFREAVYLILVPIMAQPMTIRYYLRPIMLFPWRISLCTFTVCCSLLVSVQFKYCFLIIIEYGIKFTFSGPINISFTHRVARSFNCCLPSYDSMNTHWKKMKINPNTQTQSLSLLIQHTSNLIKSQIRNTLIKIQMFFTETSRKKGHTRDDTTKVIRIHLLGFIPYYSKLIISTPYSKATPRDHIISFLHMHYPTAPINTAKKTPPIDKEKESFFFSTLCERSLPKF